MSRVIKFRAWDAERASMYTSAKWVEFRHYSNGVMVAVNYNREGNEQYLELMQFTGLLDKNGAEIYEGDIVRWDVNETSVRAPVGYEGGGFYMLKAINKNYGNVYNDWLRGSHFVLGNIYENPELLEAQS